MKELIPSDRSVASHFSGGASIRRLKGTLIDRIDQFILLILVFLWFYTGLDKVLNYPAYSKAMHYQILPRELLWFLVPLLPVLEIALGCLLMIPKLKRFGFLCSTVLMMAFTIYAGLVYFGYFPLRPCACAGLFSKLTWGSHLLINIFLTLVALFGLIIYRIRRKEERTQPK